MKKMCADLAEEQHELDAFVADLNEAGWSAQTPAEGWTIKDQIRHLAYYEDRARLAASDPEVFKRWLDEIQQDSDRFRKHIEETGKDLNAKETLKWMSIAQAYAGDPGQGRKPGIFSQRNI